jgi:hypothetical protein
MKDVNASLIASGIRRGGEKVSVAVLTLVNDWLDIMLRP